MASGKIYVAAFSGIADFDGRQVYIQEGVTRVREGHPLLKGRESVFREIDVQYDLEDARSAPQAETPQHTPEKSEPTDPGPVPDDSSSTGPAVKVRQRGPRRSGA